MFSGSLCVFCEIVTSARAPMTILHKSVSVEKLFVRIFKNILEFSTDIPVLSAKYIHNGYIEHFSAPVQTVAGPTKAHAQWLLGLFPGGKAAGARRLPHTTI